MELSIVRADPAEIDERPVSQLRINILPFLRPSRFVSSDRLKPFAQAELGHLPKGYQRVNEICSWIHDCIVYRRAAATARPLPTSRS